MTPAGTHPYDFLFGRQTHLYTNPGGSVWIYDFADAAEAAAAGARVSADGHNYRGPDYILHVNWIGPPHFFRGGSAIVLYVGRDAAVLGALCAALGTQFAGH